MITSLFVVCKSSVVCKLLSMLLKEVRHKTGAGQAAAIISSLDFHGLNNGRIASVTIAIVLSKLSMHFLLGVQNGFPFTR